MSNIAESVKIRHGKGDQFVFDVDGADFPWWITEKGPQVTRLRDDLWSVHVEILCLTKPIAVNTGLSFEAVGYLCRQIKLGGREFPWTITEDGITFHASRTEAPMVELSFFARSVDTDGVCEDAREVQDIDGYIYGVKGEVEYAH